MELPRREELFFSKMESAFRELDFGTSLVEASFFEKLKFGPQVVDESIPNRVWIVYTS